jgi:hypothetical protein
VAGALDHHVDLAGIVAARVQDAAGTHSFRNGEAEFVDVRDGHVGGAERLGDLHGEQSDRAGAGHEHAVARGNARLAARPDADGQWLHKRAHVVRHAIGQRKREVLVDGHVVGEGPVDRRCGEERDVGAKVVPARPALAAAAAWDPRLKTHAIADRMLRDLRADCLDSSGGLVTQHERRPHNQVPDAAVLVPVDVRSAHADRSDSHEHLARPRRRNRTLLHHNLARANKHCRAIRQ